MVLGNNLPGLNQRRNVLAVPATLEAAGAWRSVEVFVADFEFLTLYMSYIRGGAAGAFDLRVEYSPYVDAVTAAADGVEEWYQDGAYSVGAVAAGVEVLSLTQQERVNYTAEGAGQENFMIQVGIHRGMERARISVRETGNVGAPGDVGITTYTG